MMASMLAWTPIGPSLPDRPLKAYSDPRRRKTWYPCCTRIRPKSDARAFGNMTALRGMPREYARSGVSANRHLQPRTDIGCRLSRYWLQIIRLSFADGKSAMESRIYLRATLTIGHCRVVEQAASEAASVAMSARK